MNSPDTLTILGAAILLLVIGGILGLAISRLVRTQRLKRRFGPEYERLLSELGDKNAAEKELTARLERVESLEIRSLSHDEASHFLREWRLAQAQFLDEPFAALEKANLLIRQVLELRGYDVNDFDQRVADISVDYPSLVSNYQHLHEIVRGSEGQRLGLEELRLALLRARGLFEKLVAEKVEKRLDEKEMV